MEKIKIKTNQKSFERKSQEAEKVFDNLLDIFRRAVEMGAKYEQRTHTYRDHPGSGLEEATRGEAKETTGILTGSEIRATLIMDKPYAEYVVARGLSNIEQASLLVKRQIDMELAKINRKLNSL